MKTRSSSGVGQKIDLEFDVDSLRIRDLGEDEDDAPNTGTTASGSILSNLKRNTTTTTTDNPSDGAAVGKVKAEVDSTALRGFLNNLST